ncbi:MAG: hypothetical protein ACLQUZ_14195 [Rhizomicrobium sp.]
MIKRIRKLHWMGMDEEARQLELVVCGLKSREVLVSDSFETD